MYGERRDMMKIFLLFVSLFSFAVGATNAFDRDDLIYNTNVSSGVSSGFFDPARFSMSQSYSMSYSSGSNENSWNGLYLNTLKYKFQVPVTLKVGVGFTHQPNSFLKVGSANKNIKNASFVIPQVELDYRPSNNTLIRFRYVSEKGLGGTFLNNSNNFGFNNTFRKN